MKHHGIVDYIPKGKENKISRQSLVLCTGLPDRSVRRLISAARAEGHAIVGELLDGCDDVHLVTIMPRGSSGGHTLLLPEKESDFTTRTQLLDFVSMALGGYAASGIFFANALPHQ